jgi:L-ascorbate metabolism protein UlaG (beta-lactamase superfamily)
MVSWDCRNRPPIQNWHRHAPFGRRAFPISGPIRYTFNGKEAARATRALNAHTVIPIHYEGWSHFRESRAESEQAYAKAGLTDRVRWLPLGARITIEV